MKVTEEKRGLPKHHLFLPKAPTTHTERKIHTSCVESLSPTEREALWQFLSLVGSFGNGEESLSCPRYYTRQTCLPTENLPSAHWFLRFCPLLLRRSPQYTVLRCCCPYLCAIGGVTTKTAATATTPSRQGVRLSLEASLQHTETNNWMHFTTCV